MADVSVEVAGRRYRLACDEGEEARLEALARTIDREARALAGRLTQPPGEARLLLMAALMIADRLEESADTAEELRARLAQAEEAQPAARGDGTGAGDLFQHDLDAARAARIEAVAERIEGLTLLLGKG